MVINFVANLGISIKSRKEREIMRDWCYDTIGPIGEKWDWFISDKNEIEYCFEREKDYTMFLLRWT